MKADGGAARERSADEERVLVLQGGGALGAYQAGAFEALAEAGSGPDWIAGISIGAINAALIAGSAPQARVRRLRDFWEAMTPQAGLLPHGLLAGIEARKALNQAHASIAALCGLPGFFTPRIPPAPLHPHGAPGALSFYDTTPLRRTLERLVDFDRLNDGSIRLAVGAVNVVTGNFTYFDTKYQALDARHIMASAALPPGFPPIEIDGEWYWDGGLVSNTPLQYVVDQPGAAKRLVFQVDLFACNGPMPANLVQVAEREKDIRYSSRTRLNTHNAMMRHVLAQAARRLTARLPPSYADDPDVLALRAASQESAVTVVHLIYRRKPYESHFKDYEFSRLSMEEHWTAGRDDVLHTFAHREWLRRRMPDGGVLVLDLTRERFAPAQAAAAPALAQHLGAEAPG